MKTTTFDRTGNFVMRGEGVSACNGEDGGSVYYDKCTIPGGRTTGKKVHILLSTNILELGKYVSVPPGLASNILNLSGPSAHNKIDSIVLSERNIPYPVSRKEVYVDDLTEGIYPLKVNQQSQGLVKSKNMVKKLNRKHKERNLESRLKLTEPCFSPLLN